MLKDLEIRRRILPLKILSGNFRLGIVMLQEQKKSYVQWRCLNSLWGNRNIEWTYSPTEGTAGGMMFGWKRIYLRSFETEYGLYSLSVKFKAKREGNFWWLSCIYGSSVYSSKSEFWNDLNDLGNLIDGPWCVRGDFNEILYSTESKRRLRSDFFNGWVSNFTLIDLPLLNIKHTWSSFHVTPHATN